ncbi:FMN-binding protein [Mangrovibacterium sp.]|uniref:FMN-binding protein n=1 Tax=Mangrovibacterium sp. TaxID=1961364 RepID=UPI003568E44F
MKQKIYIATLITLLFTCQLDLFGLDSGKILKVLVKEMKVSKGDLELQLCQLNDQLKDKVNAIYQVRIKGEDKGYLIDANGMGRYDEFRFLVLTDVNKSTEMVRVIHYISDHGGEITSKKWLSQFDGFKGGDLKYGEDIQAISGATLSASSITNRIQEIIVLLKQAEMQVAL